MTKTEPGILNCLNEAERSHARQFPGGRSVDQTWAAWYADYLLNQTSLLEYTSREWTAQELAEALGQLQSAYQNSSQNQPWRVYAAARLNL